MNFVGIRGWFYLISLLVIVPGVVFLAIAPGLRPGIDFTGGSTMTLAFEANVDQGDLRERLSALGHPEATVQKLGDDTYFIRTSELNDAEKSALTDGLEARLSPDGLTELSFDLVSPIVASETVVNAIYAVIAAAVGIFIYVWWAFRNVPSPFRYGAAAIVALLHDTIIVIGIFAILGVLLEIEVGTMFPNRVADRHRLQRQRHDRRFRPDSRECHYTSQQGTIRGSQPQHFRDDWPLSLNTSLTLMVTLLALYLFGGTTIREFLLVLLIGVVAGTYSSIAVASQVLISWGVRRHPVAVRPGPQTESRYSLADQRRLVQRGVSTTLPVACLEVTRLTASAASSSGIVA